jgi:hypothetical protein
MRIRSGQNSENYRWLLLLLQQDLVATGIGGWRAAQVPKSSYRLMTSGLTVLSTKNNGFWLAVLVYQLAGVSGGR